MPGASLLFWLVAVRQLPPITNPKSKTIAGPAFFSRALLNCSFFTIHMPLGAHCSSISIHSQSIFPLGREDWWNEWNWLSWAITLISQCLISWIYHLFHFIPQKKNSIIKHSSIPVINYCYNIILLPQLKRNESKIKKIYLLFLIEWRLMEWCAAPPLKNKVFGCGLLVMCSWPTTPQSNSQLNQQLINQPFLSSLMKQMKARKTKEIDEINWIVFFRGRGLGPSHNPPQEQSTLCELRKRRKKEWIYWREGLLGCACLPCAEQWRVAPPLIHTKKTAQPFRSIAEVGACWLLFFSCCGP